MKLPMIDLHKPVSPGCTSKARARVLAIAMTGVVLMSGLGAGPATQPWGQPAAAAASTDTPSSRERDRSSRRNRDRSGRERSSSAALVSASDPYAILRSRSIFVKGNQALLPESVPVSESTSRANSLTGVPEAALIFNGVIMVGSEANAMIENTGENRTSLVKTGDSISVGKVSGITFDDLSYEASGKTHHISIGQTLAGMTPSQTSSFASTPTPTTMPSAAPGVIGGSPAIAPSGGASPEEILARLKARRNQELGNK